MPCNAPRAAAYMQRCGLDGIIASSPVNITYFTDYHCWLDGQFKEFMVKPGGSGDLLPAFALYRPAGTPRPDRVGAVGGQCLGLARGFVSLGRCGS